MEAIVDRTIETEHQGDTWVGQWVRYRYPDPKSSDGLMVEMKDHWLIAFKKESDALVPVPSEMEKEVFAALINERVQELQKEYNISSSGKVLYAEAVTIAESIIKRAWAGEWMGQQNSLLYTQHIASILDIEPSNIYYVMGSLGQERKAGLNGNIVIPWEEENTAYKRWEASTGHKSLTMGDFGNWGCSFCHQYGDEHDSPSSVKCVPKTTTEGNHNEG